MSTSDEIKALEQQLEEKKNLLSREIQKQNEKLARDKKSQVKREKKNLIARKAQLEQILVDFDDVDVLVLSNPVRLPVTPTHANGAPRNVSNKQVKRPVGPKQSGFLAFLNRKVI